MTLYDISNSIAVFGSIYIMLFNYQCFRGFDGKFIELMILFVLIQIMVQAFGLGFMGITCYFNVFTTRNAVLWAW